MDNFWVVSLLLSVSDICFRVWTGIHLRETFPFSGQTEPEHSKTLMSRLLDQQGLDAKTAKPAAAKCVGLDEGSSVDIKTHKTKDTKFIILPFRFL